MFKRGKKNKKKNSQTFWWKLNLAIVTAILSGRIYEEIYLTGTTNIDKAELRKIPSRMIIKLILWVICTANLLALGLESECPKGCTCEENKVDCSHSSRNKFPDQIPANTTFLNFASCGIKELDRKAFAKFNRVQQLCLEWNNITKINSEIFKLMTALRRLDISNNLITDVHKRAFTGLSKLSGLILMSNKIVELNGALSRTHELTFLNLADNKLTEINKEEFAKLTKLKFLDLGSNLITTIHPKAFENLKQLRYLILQNNKIISLGDLSFSSRLLSLVDFSKNALIRMPRGLPESVTDFRAGRNKIESIEKDDISNMTRLRLLTLNDNSIAQIHNDVFKDARNLKEIWLTSNKLTSLPKSWPAGLVKLFVNSNKIKKIEQDTFGKNLNLEYLTLEMNEITKIAEKSFSQLNSLTYLNFQGNKLAQLSKDAFVGMSKLQVLTLANNPIANIEAKALGNLDALTKLDMSYNELNNIKINMDIFKAMPKLKELNLMNSPGLAKGLLGQIKESEISPVLSVQTIDLRYNNLHNLPSELPSTFPNLTMLKLGSNAWHCNLELIWMKKWLASPKIKFDDDSEENLVCCTPSNLKGKIITDVPDKDFLLTASSEDEPVITEEDDDDEEGEAKMGESDLTKGEISQLIVGEDSTKSNLILDEAEVKTTNKDNMIQRRSRKKRKKSSGRRHRKKSRKDRTKRKVSKNKTSRKRNKT